MANQLTKGLEILFEKYLDGFEAACVVSQQASFFFPDQKDMQRGGDVVYRPQDYMMNVTSGLDLSASSPTDLIQRQVPAAYKQPNNILWNLDAKQLRDPLTLEKSGKAAGMRLAAQIDADVASTAALWAGQTVTGTGVFSWDLGATAEAQLFSVGISPGYSRNLVLNPKDYKDVAKELGFRQYVGGVVETAYEKAKIPDIASFDTMRNDSMANVAASAVTGLTLGANASYTPTAMTGDIPTDNRTMTITLSATGLKAGDKITIAGVNRVHMQTKADTGDAATFSIISATGTTAVITPPIIPTGAYQNVTAQGASGAAVTLLNTTTAPSNVYWADGALELMAGRLAFPTDSGAKVMSATSKQGIPLIMSYFFDHIKGVYTCRFTSLYGVTVLQPEMVGVILANQA